jgi:hypothetical protein
MTGKISEIIKQLKKILHRLSLIFTYKFTYLLIILAVLVVSVIRIVIGGTQAADTVAKSKEVSSVSSEESVDASTALSKLLFTESGDDDSGLASDTILSLTDDEREMLESYCMGQNDNFSLWLENMKTGEIFAYNRETPYYAASVLKVPYAMWLIDLAEEGKIDLTKDLQNDYMGAEGNTALEADNDSSTVAVWDLIGAMLSASDNNATYILSEYYPAGSEFQSYLEELGYSEPESCSIIDGAINGNVTVKDGALSMKEVYLYLQDGKYSDELYDAFSMGYTDNLLSVPDNTDYVEKYGSWDYAFHDEIAVLSDTPYILICYTDYGDSEVDFPDDAVKVMNDTGEIAYDLICDQDSDLSSASD